jgi:hypothetical protein
MSLKEWEANAWLRVHKTSRQEIQNLFAIVRRDLADARAAEVSADWRFGIAYNAALKLCTILLYAEGYRPAQNLAHYRTLQALPLILGTDRKEDAHYLDTCRIKRNTVEYDYAGGASEEDADELIEFTEHLEKDVMDWLRTKHANWLPTKPR